MIFLALAQLGVIRTEQTCPAGFRTCPRQPGDGIVRPCIVCLWPSGDDELGLCLLFRLGMCVKDGGVAGMSIYHASICKPLWKSVKPRRYNIISSELYDPISNVSVMSSQCLRVVARLTIKRYWTRISLNTGNFCALVDDFLELNTCVMFYS